MADFREYQPALAPAWLRGPKGTAWLRALGDCKDQLVERAKAAVKSRFPGIAPFDALALIGAERGIPRAPGESLATYRTRVQGAWHRWPWAGTPYGLLRELRDYGYPTAMLCIVNGRRYRLDAAGELVIEELAAGSWSCDATPEFWSKFQLVFEDLPPGWSPIQVGPTVDELPGSVGEPPRVELARPELHHYLRSTRLFIHAVRNPDFDTGILRVMVDFDDEPIPSWNVVLEHHLDADLTVPVDLDDYLPEQLRCGLRVTVSDSQLDGAWSCAVTAAWSPADHSAEIELLRTLIRRWKPAHATCAGIVASTNGTWGTPGAWGAGTWGDTAAKLWTA